MPKNTRKPSKNRAARTTNKPAELSQHAIERNLFRVFSSSPLKVLNIKQIVSKAGLKGQVSEEDVKKTLDILIQKELIKAVPDFKYKLNADAKFYIGKLENHRDGYHFIYVDSLKQNIVLPSDDLMAFPGDTVRVRLTGHGKTQLRGRVTHVLEQVRKEYVGTIQFERYSTYFIPQESKVRPDFIVPDEGLNGAKDGDKVVVEIERWRKGRPEARVLRILGATGNHEVEMHSIVLEFGLKTHFDPAVEEEAANISREVPPEELARRRDMRNVTTFTIDPADAKDFDDAISFRFLENGRYEVGVHIADVTYYLQEGTALDQEAFERGTSVYLVDRTLPMLPEVLSNDLCSLRPNEDRLTFSAVFELDNDGKIHNEWFGRTIIHSDRRFAYEEAQEILDAKDGEYSAELLKLNELAYALRRERFANGSINFESDEVKFRLDEKGKPVEVYVKVRKDAHKLIEDFMLLANKQVAIKVSHARKDPTIPFVYRVHGHPDEQKIIGLRSFVKTFGYDIDTESDRAVAKSLNKLMDKIEGRPEQHFITALAIRSMPKAVYTTENIGHYGLGFKFYTHFTSPIRRYPDVMAHRILQRLLTNQGFYSQDLLERACKHCSDTERKAAEAERASIKYKQVEYLGEMIGREFDGVISGVTDWGVYVEIIENKCEGMIPLRDLTDDHYIYEDKNHRVIGKHSKKTYRLGDKVRIRVKKTNVLKRNIDFALVRKISN